MRAVLRNSQHSRPNGAGVLLECGVIMNNVNALLAAVFASVALAAAGSLWLAESQAGLVVLGDSHVRIAHSSRNLPLTVAFTLKNESREPIVISSVKSGCSCVTSDADGVTVPAGGTTSVSVTVSTFDAYAGEFLQEARVSWSDRSLPLTVSGTLPPSDKVLYRPTRLTLTRKGSTDQRSASLVIRVPRHCGGDAPLDTADIAVSGLPTSQVVVEPLANNGGSYRDYRVVVSCRHDEVLLANHGELVATTHCERVLVPILVDHSDEAK